MGSADKITKSSGTEIESGSLDRESNVLDRSAMVATQHVVVQFKGTLTVEDTYEERTRDSIMVLKIDAVIQLPTPS